MNHPPTLNRTHWTTPTAVDGTWRDGNTLAR
jgi:hypothetical protein